jgi:hypothetical protein
MAGIAQINSKSESEKAASISFRPGRQHITQSPPSFQKTD